MDRFGDFAREIFWVGYPQGWRTRSTVEQAVMAGNTRVQKTGRTTGYTTGTIAAVVRLQAINDLESRRNPTYGFEFHCCWTNGYVRVDVVQPPRSRGPT